jgi:ribonuclease BN (tRNA processing enzyme)
MKLTRRSLLSSAGFAALAAHAGRSTVLTQPAKTRLILLGTAGGPSPKKTRAAPAQVITAANNAYVVDCGNGVARQLVLAGVPLRSIRHVLITHHHSDHNADYGTLLLLAWSTGLKTRVDTWGPPPLARITRLFMEMSAPDIQVRQADEGKPSLPPLIHVHELTTGGRVLEDEQVKIRCALVNHPMVKPAFAFRFDAPDRSIVISGDTTRSANLLTLARGADVLVHEVLYPPAIDAITGASPDAASLRKHLIESHTPLEEVGKIAEEAGVKTLVLTHFVPAETPAVADDAWFAGAKAHFSGEVILAKDLMEI